MVVALAVAIELENGRMEEWKNCSKIEIIVAVVVMKNR